MTRLSALRPVFAAVALVVPTTFFAASPSAFAAIEGKVAYLFDSNTTDSTTNGNNGTAVGGALYSASVPAITGSTYGANRSLNLNGSNYINGGSDASLDIGAGSFTVETWINPEVTGSSLAIAYSRFAGTSNARWGMQLRSSGIVAAAVYDDEGDFLKTAGIEELQSTTTPAQNAWTHIAFVFDRTANAATLYINGVAEDADNDISNIGQVDNPSNDLWVGTFITGGGPVQNWVGLLDEFRIVGRALSASEVAFDAANSLTVPEPASLTLLMVEAGGALLLGRRRTRS